jgi:hypothetical protein
VAWRIGAISLITANSAVWQGLRCVMNILGLTPPKRFAQASKLTQMVKAHLTALNQQVPVKQHYQLTLARHSMGGRMATCAALRNEVPAVVNCPVRLGLLPVQRWLARR